MKKFWMALAVFIMAGAVLAGSMEMTSARLYRKQGELLKSLDFYNTELEKNPTNLEALYERAEMLGEIAADSSKMDLHKQIAGDVNKPQRALFERVIAEFDKVKAGSDEKYVKKVSKKIDEFINYHWAKFYGAAAGNDTLKAYDLALEQLEMATLLKPREWSTYGLQAQIYEKMEQTDKALASWEEAEEYLDQSDISKKKPDDYKVYSEIIHARLLEGYYNSGRYREAIKYADEMSKADPSNADAVQFKAFSLAQLAADTSLSPAQQDSLRAIAVGALEEAQKARPDYPPIIYTKGQFYLQLNDTTNALKAFEDYLALDPADRDARFVVGVIYLEGGSFVNTEKARDTFKTLTEHHPEHGPAWINYGIATIRLGDTANGKKYLEKGKELSGK